MIPQILRSLIFSCVIATVSLDASGVTCSEVFTSDVGLTKQAVFSLHNVTVNAFNMSTQFDALGKHYKLLEPGFAAFALALGRYTTEAQSVNIVLADGFISSNGQPVAKFTSVRHSEKGTQVALAMQEFMDNKFYGFDFTPALVLALAFEGARMGQHLRSAKVISTADTRFSENSLQEMEAWQTAVRTLKQIYPQSVGIFMHGDYYIELPQLSNQVPKVVFLNRTLN